MTTRYEVKEWSSEIPTDPVFAKTRTLDDVYNRLLQVYPDWFVYRGGSHVSLHRDTQGDRLALIVEAA